MADMESPRLYLASASPRRAELLRQIGVRFAVCPADLDERVLAGEPAGDYVLRLARAKAMAVLEQLGKPAGIRVLGADTCVQLDGQILGKPAGRAEARHMLERLSGRTHEVLTGVALAGGQSMDSQLVCTRVRFRPLAAAEITAYWATGEPQDKAGAYAIQGYGAVFVQHLEGSYSGVVGLPLQETAGLLARAGIACWAPDIRMTETGRGPP